jgi:hypothetical protein
VTQEYTRRGRGVRRIKAGEEGKKEEIYPQMKMMDADEKKR